MLMLLVVLAPLPLGSNREWAWTLCAAWAGVLGLVAGLSMLWRRQPAPPGVTWLPLALFGIVAAWIWLQVVPWTPVAWHHPAWDLAAQALGEPLAGRVSLSPDDTAAASMRLASYALVFALAFHFGREPLLARRGLQWLALAGCIYSVYGLWVYGSGSGAVLWLQSPGWTRDVRATFINHNHFATWAGLCLLCALALFHGAATLRRNPAYRMPLDAGARLEAFLLRSWRPLSAVLLITAALILSHSRGGFISACAGGAVLLLSIQWRSPIRRWSSRAAVLVSLAAVALVFWLSSEGLLQRMDRLTADYQSRLDAYALTMEGIGDNPMLGFGYGAFADSMRLYRTERIEGFYDKAHNTYLETAMELGWPASLALGITMLLLVSRCVAGLGRSRQGWIYAATGLGASALVGAHALVDFSIQIPAVALAYAAIMGIACAQSGVESRRTPLVYTAAQPTDVTRRPV